MTDDQSPVDVEQDPEVQAAEAVEARAHVVVERVRADALARAKHARDLAAVQARVDAEETAKAPPAAVPAAALVTAPAPEPQALTPHAPDPAEVAPVVAEPVPAPETPPMSSAEPPAAPVVDGDEAGRREAETRAEAARHEAEEAALAKVEAPFPVAPVVPEPAHETATEAPVGCDAPPAPVAPEPVAKPASTPEPEPAAPVEARSKRAPFATGKTRPGPKTWRQGAIISLTDHEWARVRSDLTDAEAADGEAGGTRLQALVARYGADVTWSVARPA